MISGISAVADEAAHWYVRKLFERCHGLSIFTFGGWVPSPRLRTRPFIFPRYGRLGNGINHVFPYGMGGVLRGCGRSHPLLSALLVCEVPLDILYPRGDTG